MATEDTEKELKAPGVKGRERRAQVRENPSDLKTVPEGDEKLTTQGLSTQELRKGITAVVERNKLPEAAAVDDENKKTGFWAGIGAAISAWWGSWSLAEIIKGWFSSSSPKTDPQQASVEGSTQAATSSDETVSTSAEMTAQAKQDMNLYAVLNSTGEKDLPALVTLDMVQELRRQADEAKNANLTTMRGTVLTTTVGDGRPPAAPTRPSTPGGTFMATQVAKVQATAASPISGSKNQPLLPTHHI